MDNGNLPVTNDPTAITAGSDKPSRSPSINIPNVVTVGRVFLAIFTLPLLWMVPDAMKWTAFGLTIFVIWADGIDGYLARKLNQTSKLGGILDIAGDRVVEMAYWIAFAALGWIPVWVPLLFLVRGTFVDAIRAHAVEQGYTAFGKNTMMQTAIGKFLVASNFSRFTYAVVKAVAFCLIVGAHTALGAQMGLESIALFFVYFSCVFCVIRGLPVILESSSVFRHEG
ncbi:MAG: CDP-alcohol phosphatidyltransferase family protein [Candidatus Obscuribacterales bacterium]|nr:CDP-alcohol phosphatidyltransferase family protein [Candidatus Obscuribacterales bacterium]